MWNILESILHFVLFILFVAFVVKLSIWIYIKTPKTQLNSSHACHNCKTSIGGNMTARQLEAIMEEKGWKFSAYKSLATCPICILDEINTNGNFDNKF
jgi:hypothetical protein